MKEVKFIKCHGSGNDFIIIDEISHNYDWLDTDRRQLTLELCERKGSVGADGILFVQSSVNSDAKMRIFNADGSEAEMCGNGLRCVGRYITELLNKETVHIETMKADYIVKKVDSIYKDIPTIDIELKSVDFNVKTLPMNYHAPTCVFQKLEELSDELLFTALSVPNPHIVTFVQDFNEDEILRIGTTANTLKELFTCGVNVNFVKVLSDKNLYVKTYERGVGPTMSCGTGMTASSIVYSLQDDAYLGKELNVFNDGGMIKCVVNKDYIGNYTVNLIGNASYIYRASIDIDSESKEEAGCFSVVSYEEEIEKYDEFLRHTKTVIGSP